MSAAPKAAVELPLDGQLGDGALLPRLYAALARNEWSGVVHVVSSDVERRVFFVDGRLSAATSNDPTESLGALLVAEGLVAPSDVERAAAHLGSAERAFAFGRQLVKLHLLDEKQLARAERRRVIAIAEATLTSESGSYRCSPGVAVGDAQPAQALEVSQLVATAILGRWDDARALAALGGRDVVLDLVPERLSDYEATGADEAYDLTFLRVNGHRTVAEVVALAPLPEGAALRFLAACALLSCVRAVGVRPSQVPAAPQEEDPEDLAATAPIRPPPSSAPVAAAQAEAPRPPAAKPPDASKAEAPPRPERPVPERAASETPASVAAPSSRPRWWLVALLAITVLVAVAWAAVTGWNQMARDSAGEAPAQGAPP